MTKLIEYSEASDEVRAIYDDIMRTRQTDYINNFWKALASHPPGLKHAWEQTKRIMSGPGAIDLPTRELIYLAVSIANACEYCIASHTAAARAKGVNDQVWGEFMAIVALAGANNKLATGYRIEVDERFKQP